MTKHILLLMFLCTAACATGAGQTDYPADDTSAVRLLYPYESSLSCKGCHSSIYLQYKDSMHAGAFDNPLFDAQYFKDVVPRALRDSSFAPEARDCVRCHAPVVYMNYTGLITSRQQAEAYETGVTCDFCHTLTGSAPNGDYKQNPSRKKLGPLQVGNSWHAEYSGYFQLSEFCEQCHNDRNHRGLEIKSTFSEWQQSGFVKSGVLCQDCHMNRSGYLDKGRAEFEQGEYVHMNMITGEARVAKTDKLYNHSFPGAHSNRQLTGALRLDIQAGSNTGDSGSFRFRVVVDNTRVGHRMPSGSSDLRFMWLEILAIAKDGTTLPVSPVQAAPQPATPDYSLAGGSMDDSAILGSSVPVGSRLYRAVFVDGTGKQSLLNYDSVAKRFDNRLGPGEKRIEEYSLKLPSSYAGNVTLQATLRYLAAPASFTGWLGVPAFEPVVVSEVKKVIPAGASWETPK